MKQREIKFRVWDNVDYMSTPFTLHDLQMRKVMFTQDCILMQFTGLLDKNGKEIYEGDVVITKGIDYNSDEYKKWADNEFEGEQPEDVEVNRDVVTLENFRYWLKNESFGYEGEDL